MIRSAASASRAVGGSNRSAGTDLAPGARAEVIVKRNGITRRDFINGVALPVAAAGLGSSVCAWGSSPGAGPGVGAVAAADYPPALTGLRGSHPGSFETAHALARGGRRWERPAAAAEETYDLVVVGAGISGLAAAYLFRQQAGPQARILLLDNHDDFGGHAKRNEFTVDGRLLLGYGGSQSIDGPATYSRVAAGVIREIGIETARFYHYYDREFLARNRLTNGILFSRQHHGASRLVADPLHAASDAELQQRLARFPGMATTRQALHRMYRGELPATETIRGLARRPAELSTEAFLRQALDMPDQGLALLRNLSLTWWGFGLDALSLREACEYGFLGEAFAAAVAGLADATAAHPPRDEPYIFHFPDGNAAIARLLVRSLVPGALPGASMEDAVLSRLRYEALDREGNSVRLRLHATAIDVRNADGGVDVTYVGPRGVSRVRAGHAILACYNNMVPHLCPELGETQRSALEYPEKIPLAVVNVALRDWQPIAASGFGQVYAPQGLLVRMGLDFPVSMGGYAYPQRPDQPVLLDCWHAAVDPDTSLHIFERLRRGRQRMLEQPFEAYETAVREQLTEAWGQNGFDPDRDLAAITVNRWPHGYAWEYTDLWDDRSWGRGAGPHVVARQQIGRISIANSDSEAFAYVNGAIDAAYRAVREQTSL